MLKGATTMTDLMEVLYSYAQDHMLRGLLDREPEYANVRHCAGRQEEALGELVGEENKKRLENLLDERKLMSFYEGQAFFAAGFQVALELTR